MKILGKKIKKKKIKKIIVMAFAIIAILFFIASSIVPFLSYLK